MVGNHGTIKKYYSQVLFLIVLGLLNEKLGQFL